MKIEFNGNIKEDDNNEIPTKVAYANWIDNDIAFESDKNCLNIDKYIFSDFPRLPIFKFESKQELDEFNDKYKDTFTMDQGYNEVPSFNDVTNNYDDEFFKNNTLMLTYNSANSGSYRYTIREVKKENAILVLIVTSLNNQEECTDDRAGSFVRAEVPKEYIKDCKAYDAQLIEDYSVYLNMIESEFSF